ncbi:hypothetical protein MGALLINA_05820 [Mycoplasmopsis gallinarum]|uniref:Uncharacterized protein n=1 Tax=Mycoplasmopsis gallinarum TaxID=29557 RepID=A0A162MH94_9BACT|nr:hypothetical protein MGALLINA_05820 [Mycoplasmopsis gallinarum]
MTFSVFSTVELFSDEELVEFSVSSFPLFFGLSFTISSSEWSFSSLLFSISLDSEWLSVSSLDFGVKSSETIFSLLWASSSIEWSWLESFASLFKWFSELFWDDVSDSVNLFEFSSFLLIESDALSFFSETPVTIFGSSELDKEFTLSSFVSLLFIFLISPFWLKQLGANKTGQSKPVNHHLCFFIFILMV